MAGAAPGDRQFCAQAQGGDTRSRRVEEHGEKILALWEARKDITLDELRVELAEWGLVVANSTLHRFFARHGITRKKKTGHAIEQDRPDVLRQRRAWFDGQIDLDPERLVFIDGSEAEAEGDKPGPRPT